MEEKLFRVTAFLLFVTLGLLWFVKQHDPAIGRGDQVLTTKNIKENTLVPVTVTALDVGQGDATFITWPNGTQMMIDCGRNSTVLEGLGRAMPFYDRTIDYLVVTHPDIDHYGGCTDVLKRFEIKNFVYTGLQKPDAPWLYFRDTAQKEGAAYHQIDAGDTWEIASTTIRFLYPDHDVTTDGSVPGFTKSLKDNNTSIIIKLSVGETDMLLTGDAEQELEQYLTDTYHEQLHSEILHVSHHGSGGSSILPFVQAVQPNHAIISVGADNDYGHPSQRVLKRLERLGAKIWRTDQDGDITIRMFEDRVEVEGQE